MALIDTPILRFLESTLVSLTSTSSPGFKIFRASSTRSTLMSAAFNITKTSLANYNNFYEFSVDKERVAAMAQDFKISPWEIEVGGLVKNPGRYQVENLLTKFDQEERVYRLR